MELYGVDDVYYLSNLEEHLKNYLKEVDISSSKTENVGVWYDFDNPAHTGVHDIMKRLKNYRMNNCEEKYYTNSPRYVSLIKLLQTKREGLIGMVFSSKYCFLLHILTFGCS